ncbi:Hypothetical protein J6891_04890 [Nakaseomyces glabratus]
MGLRRNKTLPLGYKRNSCTALSQSTYCTADFHTNSIVQQLFTQTQLYSSFSHRLAKLRQFL